MGRGPRRRAGNGMTSMTSVSSGPIAGPDQGAIAPDLSSAFGASAASSLRGVLPRSKNVAQEVEEPIQNVDEPIVVKSASLEPKPVEDDVQDSRNRSAPRAARPARTTAPTPTVTRGRSDAPAPRRRFRVVRVRDRRDVDVLLLAVAKKGPANGREFVDLVREHSDGVFMLTERTVYHELHRLRNNRLIRVMRNGGARRYVLTTLGERVLATRRRQWQAFSHGFDGVLEAADYGDHS